MQSNEFGSLWIILQVYWKIKIFVAVDTHIIVTNSKGWAKWAKRTSSDTKHYGRDDSEMSYQ